MRNQVSIIQRLRYRSSTVAANTASASPSAGRSAVGSGRCGGSPPSSGGPVPVAGTAKTERGSASVARPGGMTVTSAARRPGRAVRSPRAPAPPDAGTVRSVTAGACGAATWSRRHSAPPSGPGTRRFAGRPSGDMPHGHARVRQRAAGGFPARPGGKDRRRVLTHAVHPRPSHASDAAADPSAGVAGASAFPPGPAHVPGAIVESGRRSHRTAVHVVERLPPAVLRRRDHHRAGRAAVAVPCVSLSDVGAGHGWLDGVSGLPVVRHPVRRHRRDMRGLPRASLRFPRPHRPRPARIGLPHPTVPSKPRAALRRARLGSREAGSRRIRLDPQKTRGFLADTNYLVTEHHQSIIGLRVCSIVSARKLPKCDFFAVNDGIRLAKNHRIWRSEGDFTTIYRGIR